MSSNSVCLSEIQFHLSITRGAVEWRSSLTEQRFQHWTNSLPRPRKTNRPPQRQPCSSQPYLTHLIVDDLVRTSMHPCPDSCSHTCPICQRDGGLFITVKNITALLPEEAAGWKMALQPLLQRLQLASTFYITHGGFCLFSPFFFSHIPPSALSQLSPRRKRFIYGTTCRHHRQGLIRNNNSSNAKKVKNPIKFKVKYPVHPNSAIRMQFAAQQ